MTPLDNTPFIGPQLQELESAWCHVCSVVALDWVDLTNVANMWNVHSLVMCMHLKSHSCCVRPKAEHAMAHSVTGLTSRTQ